MNAPAAAAADPSDALQPGVSFYQVLEPSAVLGPQGLRQYAMHGPFGDFDQAQAYAAARPGSLVTVTHVLHRSRAAPIAAGVDLAAVQPFRKGK